MEDLTWIEISKSKLKHNIQTIHSLIGSRVLLMPCIKANAYGHGIREMAHLFIENGADWLTVHSIKEAEVLRKAGITQPILVMGYIQKSDLIKVNTLDVRVFISDFSTAETLSQIAQKTDKQIPIHVKVDTGMSRLGVLDSQAKDFIIKVKGLKGLIIEGLVTHFATVDDFDNREEFKQQFDRFQSLLQELKNEKIQIPLIHCANSSAILLHPETYFDMVRPGLALYGYYDNKKIEEYCHQKNINLLPILTFKTKVALVKEIPAGRGVSYSHLFKTTKPLKVAVVPVGYYDGIDTRLNNKGFVLIKGKKARILGRVCMNMIIVDVNNIPNVQKEDEVTIIGEQGKEKISADEIADLTGMINYEVLTRLHENIPHYYLD